jgi:hypothetical protein
MQKVIIEKWRDMMNDDCEVSEDLKQAFTAREEAA